MTRFGDDVVPPEYLLEFDVGTVIVFPLVVTCCQETDEMAELEETLQTRVMLEPKLTEYEL